MDAKWWIGNDDADPLVTDEDFAEPVEEYEDAEVEEQRERDFFDTFGGYTSALGSWTEFERIANEARWGVASRQPA